MTSMCRCQPPTLDSLEQPADFRWPGARIPAALAALAARMVVLVMVAAVCPAAASVQAEELAPNGGFERGFDGWTRWGRNADLITLDEARPHVGRAAARLEHGQNALYFKLPMTPGTAYELRCWYRTAGARAAGQVHVNRMTEGGVLKSAGYQVFPLDSPAAAAGEWTEFRTVFMPSRTTASGQVAFFVLPESTLWLDDISLRVVPRPEGLVPPPDPWDGLGRRTAEPLFEELLSAAPGRYTVSSWAHDLGQAPRPGSSPADARQADADWRREAEIIVAEAGAAGIGLMILPVDNRPVSMELLRDEHRRHGVTFDVWSEGSASLAAALDRGAEVLNPAERAQGAPPTVSIVDPHYVDAQEEVLRRLGAQFRDEPATGKYYGKDEPYGRLSAAAPDARGPHGRAMAEEVRDSYGFGRYALPEPGDAAFNADPERPLRWLAFNRWFDDQFSASRARLSRALHETHPSARYSPANYWFMSGFGAFDYSRLAAASDVMTLDPYASSAEGVLRGRGVFNHGFGAKFMRDLTGKPVCIIAQAFDYAGYSMTPDDLREWVSQALRCGATEIQFYPEDLPRRNDPERWQMMLHVARVVTRMNRIALPESADTAVLYTLPTHMSHGPMAHGPASGGNQVYAAHALVGELAGSWFDFVSDAQLERGEKSLAGYKVVHLPVATIMTPEATRILEDYVRGGGTLVCGDAAAFTSDLAGADTSAARERLLGIRLGGPREAGAIRLVDAAWGLPAETELRVWEARLSDKEPPVKPWAIEPLAGARVIGTYADGAAAVVEHALGTGRVITFAANPFAPAVTVDESPWPALFKGLQEACGCRVDLPIWRFLLPPPEAD